MIKTKNQTFWKEKLEGKYNFSFQSINFNNQEYIFNFFHKTNMEKFDKDLFFDVLKNKLNNKHYRFIKSIYNFGKQLKENKFLINSNTAKYNFNIFKYLHDKDKIICSRLVDNDIIILINRLVEFQYNDPLNFFFRRSDILIEVKKTKTIYMDLILHFNKLFVNPYSPLKNYTNTLFEIKYDSNSIQMLERNSNIKDERFSYKYLEKNFHRLLKINIYKNMKYGNIKIFDRYCLTLDLTNVLNNIIDNFGLEFASNLPLNNGGKKIIECHLFEIQFNEQNKNELFNKFLQFFPEHKNKNFLFYELIYSNESFCIDEKLFITLKEKIFNGINANELNNILNKIDINDQPKQKLSEYTEIFI